MSFSSDKAQSCLYVGDNSNMTIYILNRSNFRSLAGWDATAGWPVIFTGYIR